MAGIRTSTLLKYILNAGLLLWLIIAVPGVAGAQDTAAVTRKTLAAGFDNLVLGMSFEQLGTALRAHAGFQYRGEPELSLSPDGKEKIIETKGGVFIERAVFQFADNKLFSIILDLQAAKLDYFTLYTNFVTRYGNPLLLDPRQAIWDDGTTRLLLEKPLTVKYLSVAFIEAKKKQEAGTKAMQEETRELFIEKL